MIIILLAALAMIAQDILEVLKDQAQNRSRRIVAGLCDTGMWIVLIASTTISVTILQGHSLAQKVLVIVIMSGANFVGQFTGVTLGDRIIKNQVVCTCCKLHTVK